MFFQAFNKLDSPCYIAKKNPWKHLQIFLLCLLLVCFSFTSFIDFEGFLVGNYRNCRLLSEVESLNNSLKGVDALKTLRPEMPQGRIYPIHHIHIPKNSGTSLARMLEQYAPKDKRFCVRCKVGRECIEHFHSMKAEEITPCDILTTHMPFGFPERFQRKKSYFQIVILRDPLERAQSYYDYVKAQSGHRNYDDAMRNSIGKILKRSFLQPASRRERASRYKLQFFNEQTWFLCGHKCDPGKMSLEKALSKAKQNLLKKCHFVGVTENLAPLLDRLRSVYSWLPADFELKNKHDKNHTTLSADAEQIAVQLLWADIELYREATLISKVDSMNSKASSAVAS
mmetsp:Transcript_5933/g.7837  ORF Transcript_5933/g.7837 Transcript_5933/m.7837 type:complete len:341 (-) Transcript_5933:216-1238(-)